MKRRPAKRPRLLVEELERRILYSADAAALLGLSGSVQGAEVRVVEPVAPLHPAAAASATMQQTQSREIVFIDSHVPDAMKLADALMQQRGGDRTFDIVVLDADEDGVAQLDRILANEHGLAAIHIISHASDDTIANGGPHRDAARLAVDGAAVARWGHALGPGGDLLLYGCDVARDAQGLVVVQDTAPLSSAKVSQPVTAAAGIDVVVIDALLQDSTALLQAVKPGAQVFVYDSSQDSAHDVLTRVADWAQASDSRIASLSILSHGVDGAFALGNQWISASSLDATAADWRRLGSTLVAGANFEIFGCDVAAPGGQGQLLVDRLAVLTGADVFASSNVTGKGGDWGLEVASSGAQPELAAGLAMPLDLAALQESGATLAWYNANWAYRNQISIDYTKVAATQTNFPVLVSTTNPAWRSTANGGQVGQADGGDFVFTAADGTTKLDHQIESYDPVTGTLVAWVRVPSLSAVADTALYVYYGNAGVADQWNPAGVWDANYTGVWHLGDGTTLNTADSTANANTGTANNGPVAVTGEVGGAAGLDGVNDYISTTNSVTNPQEFTEEVWFRTSTASGTKIIAFQSSQTGQFSANYDRHIYVTTTGKLSFGWTDGTTFFTVTSAAAVTDGVWHHAVGVHTAAGVGTLYLDGVAQGSLTGAAQNYTGWWRLGSYNLNGANWTNGANGYFPGQIDEARVSSVARSASWIQTEYNNQSAPAAFYSLAAQEGTAPVVTLPGGALNYTENDGAVIIDAAATASDADSVNFNTGTLTIGFSANGAVNDRLAIRHQGAGAGQIGVSGTNVSYGGTTIGTFTGGVDGATPLVITFNASSTPAAAQALMRNITYTNVSEDPSIVARTVRFVLTDGSGGTSNIATQTINVAKVNDAPTVTDRALSFDGTDLVVVTPQPSLVMSAEVTIEATVQRTGALSGTQIIVNKEGEYEIGISATGKLQWAFANSTPGWNWVETSYTVPADTWVQLAVTYKNGVVNTYANGTLVDTYNGSGAIGDVYGQWNDLSIGGRQNSSEQRFTGLIDEVRVWNLERNGAQIQAAYNTPLVGNEPGLVGYWRFSENTGTVATDSSPQGNNGVLGNGVAADMPARTVNVDYTIAEGSTLNVAGVGVLARATDPEGNALTAQLVSGPAYAAAFTLNPDGSFNYTPSANFSGTDSFVFSASDGSLASQPATVVINVTPVNDAPVQVFTGTNFNGAYAYNDAGGNWFVQNTPVNTGSIQSQPSGAVLHLSSSAGGSSSSGVIAYFDGSMKLGDLQGASVASSGDALAMNLYLDTGNDGRFFSFNGNQYTGLNADSYASVTLTASGGTIDDNTVFTKVGGIAALPATFTLGQLKSGAVAGIDVNTRVALWLGGGNAFSTDISSVAVAASTAGNLTLQEDSGLTSLGLAGAAFSPGGGADEAGQTLTYTVTAVPNAAIGNVVLADGTTVVTANTSYSLAEVQGMQFRANANASGAAGTFSFTAQDSGGVANGGQDTITKSLAINVAAVNDAPVNTLPGAQITNVNTPIVLAGATAISISDADAATGQVRVTLGVADYQQGFDSNNAGWNMSVVEGGSFVAQNDATIVASGTNGITARSGSTYAVAAQNTLGAGGSAFTPFAATRAAGYSNVFPPGGFTTSVDVYLDPSGGSANDTQFDYNAAINDVAIGGNGLPLARRDFVFNAGFYNDVDATGSTNRFVISASNNAGHTVNGPRLGASPLAITTAGWYTLEHRFYDSGGGVLAVDLIVKDGSGTVLSTWTRSDPSDIIGSTVGGGRYGWFANQEFSSLAFDNVSKTSATRGTLTLGSTANLTFSQGDGTNDARMTFTGTLTDVNAALGSITYQPASNYSGSASLLLVSNDMGNTGAGGPGVAFGAVPLTVTTPPVVTTTGAPLAYTENDPATLVDPGLTVSDTDSANLTGATVTISSNYSIGQDVLAFAGQNGITGVWDAATATLTLSGTASAANYQSALRSITYVNSSDTPSTADRIVSFTVVDDTGITSTAASKTVTLAAVNDAPAITSNSAGVAASVYVAENTTGVTTVTSSDPDGGAAVYSIVPVAGGGGADAAMFSIDAGTGVLSFLAAPNYESPAAASGNNVYDVTVRVSDGNGATDTQRLSVHVVNLPDGVVVVPVSVSALADEARVNTTTVDNQQLNAYPGHAIAADANGNFVVVWESNLQDGSGYGIYGQRFSADGTRLGAEFLINTSTADQQNGASVAMDGSGNFVVVWSSNLQDGSGYGVYAQRYDATGAAQGSEFRVNTLTVDNQQFATVAMASDGSFVVSWSAGVGSGTTSGVRAQRYDAAGVAQGGEIQVNTYISNDQQYSAIAIGTDGGFMITWSSQLQDGSGWGVYGQRFDEVGNKLGVEFRVNSTTLNDQVFADVAMAADGRFVVTWQSALQDGDLTGIYAQRYAADGSTVGGEFLVNTFTANDQSRPAVAIDRSGNFTVVWASHLQDGGGQGIYGQRYAWSGSLLGAEFQVNTTTAGDQHSAAVAMVGDGRFVVAWSGNGSGDSDGVFIRRYGLATTEAGGTAMFQVVLEAAPTGDVVIPLSLADGTEGTLSTASLTFTTANWNVAQTVTVTGLQDFINDGDVACTLVLGAATSSDGRFGGLDPADLVVTNLEVPNVAPVHMVPGAQAVTEDTALVFSSANGNAIAVSDADAGTHALQMTLSVTNGTLTLGGVSGLSFTAGTNGSAAMTFSGTVADINAALDGLRFVPTDNFNGSALLTVSTNDQGNSGNGGAQSDTDAVTITVTPVNDAPTATNLDAAQSYTEDTPLALTAIVASDIDSPTVTATLTLSSAAAGSLNTGTSGAVTSTYNALSGMWRASGAVADVNALLAGLTFTPTADFSGSFTIATSVSDGVAAPVTGTKAITGIAVNDAPIRTAGTVANLTVLEDSGVTSLGLGGMAYGPGGGADESGQTLSYTVTVLPSSTIGNVFLADGTTQVTLGSYTLAEIQGMQFKTTANASGVTGFQYNVMDSGGTANGGSNSIGESVLITVTAVNDAPTLGATALNPAFTEAAGQGMQGAAVNVFGSAAASPFESTDRITGLTFTVSGLVDGANEVIVVDGQTITLGANSSGTTVTNGLTYSATLSGDTATVVLSGGTLTSAAAQTLVDGITYQNTDTDNPTAGNRVVTLTQIKDNGGTANAGVDATALAISSTVTVSGVNDAPTGAPVVTGVATEGQTLAADTSTIADPEGLGAFSYQWQRNGSNIIGATGNTYTLGDTDVGTNIRVVVSYTDGRGTAEGLTSAAVGPVANVNDAPTGAPVVTGTPTEDQILTAQTGTIADADGLGTFSYQWQRNGSNIIGATSNTYTLGDADVGTNIRVVVSYVDGQGTAESLTSAAVGPIANVNDAPTGTVTIDDATPTQGQTLTASSTVADADGLGFITYTWKADGGTVGTGASHVVTEAEVGKLITVEVSYTDGRGTPELVSSAPTAAVANVNDAPTGAPVVTGTPAEDQVLTANTATIGDADGLGTFSYQWQRGGSNIIGATSNTYTLGDADIGTNIRVVVSYIDGQGTAESLTSAAVGPIANVNDAPTGAPVVTGTPTEDQILTAQTGTIADADGLGTFSYQWQRNGSNIIGATGNTYTLGDTDVGTNIRVVVSYTDGRGTAEGLTSAAVGPVANVNDAPTGAPVVTGTPTEDQILTAQTGTIADADGLGTFSYQWQRNGSNIIGATSNTYTLGDADVGTNIRVVVSYVDGQGTAESLTSAAVGPVANVNDAPSGTNLGAPETYNQNTPLALVPIVVSDVDSPAVSVTLTLSNVAAGSLNTGTSGGVTSTYDASSGVWSASGAIADVNALLAGLSFTPAANFNADFTIATHVSDGVAPPVTGSKAITSVAPNQAPVITTATLSLQPGQPVTVSPAQLNASDADTPASMLVFSVSNVSGGRFELTSAPGVPVTQFTQPELVQGLVRFVPTSVVPAPRFDVMASDGSASSAVITVVVNVGFSQPSPPVILEPTTPPPGEAIDPGAPASTSTGNATSDAVASRTVLPRGGDITSALGIEDTRFTYTGTAPFTNPAPSLERATHVSHELVAKSPFDLDLTINPDAYLLRTAYLQALEGPPLHGGELHAVTREGGAQGGSHADDDGGAASPLVVKAAQAAGVALTVGTVLWALRATGLAASLFSSLPAWRHVDLLAVLPDDEDDDEWDGDADAEGLRDEQAVGNMLEPSAQGDA